MKTKKLLFIICIIANQFINKVSAQAPESFNYQAVARDASGTIIGNQAVGFRISLLQGGATGTNLFTETHSVITNQFGLVNFAIGNGTIVNGNFANINWAQGPYFVQVELDATNSGTFVLMNSTQLLSVPYAQYAEKSGNPTLQAGSGITIQNDTIINTGQNQLVNLTGTGQTNIQGTFPNYIVNTPNIQAGNGINLNGQTISNTAPDQTVIMNGTGQTTITGIYPNFTVNTPPYTSGTGININGQVINAQNSNPIWNANKIQDINVDTLNPIISNVLKFDGSKWKPSALLTQMTTAERGAITNPYAGMTILNTNTDCIEYYTGITWLATCGTLGNIGNPDFGGNSSQGALRQISSFPNYPAYEYQYLFTIGNFIYFNSYNGSFNNICWKYSTISNVWNQISSPSQPINNGTNCNPEPSGGSNGTFGYIFRSNDNGCTNLIRKYNSLNDTWTEIIPNFASNILSQSIGRIAFSDSIYVYFFVPSPTGFTGRLNTLNDSITKVTGPITNYTTYPFTLPCVKIGNKFYFTFNDSGNGLAIYYFDKSLNVISSLTNCPFYLNELYLFKYLNKLYYKRTADKLIYRYNEITNVHQSTNILSPQSGFVPVEVNGKLFHWYNGQMFQFYLD
jgi:hypothetical protein